MPITNIKGINYSDGQNLLIDKINHNFDEIVEAHGGSVGETGPSGDRGPIGNNGPIGITGNNGPRGTKWFVQSIFPPDGAIYGDYWVDSDDGTINIFGHSGWSSTGYNLSSSGSLFGDAESYFTNGGTGVSVGFDQISPENYTFVISDKSAQSGIINEKLAKFLISTDVAANPSPILEFMKSDLISLNPGDYAEHPIMSWSSGLPTNNDLKFNIPGGSLSIGASGGFATYSQSIDASAENFYINYGATSGSGISATGGIQMSTSANGTFSLISSNLGITGGRAEFQSNVQINGGQGGILPSISLDISGTGGIVTERISDTFNTISNSVYNVSLETNSDKEFYINTKGKIRTKKTKSGVTYQSYQNPAITSGSVNWYFVSRTGGPIQSSVVKNGNTIIITPTDPGSGNYVGIGLYNDPLYSWWGPGSILDGQSIEISVYSSPDSSDFQNSSSLFKYIGKGTTGGVTPLVTLSSPATAVDFTITKGISGGSTVVYYKAYTLSGGSGGSFIV